MVITMLIRRAGGL